MDFVISNFFWQGADGDRKNHMDKWDIVSRPKDLGGLG